MCSVEFDFNNLLLLSLFTSRLTLSHLVAAVGSTVRRSAAGPTTGSSCSRRSAQASGTDRQNAVQCELVQESEQQPASQSESMGERRLPRGQEYTLLPRVRELPRERRSLGAKVAARERGALSGPRSLPERARIAEVARDAEASETCMRSCVLPQELARRRRGLSLTEKGLFIAVWIIGRGMSESPWIAGRSERASITDVPQCGETGYRYGEAARNVQSAGGCCKNSAWPHGKRDPETELERRHRPVTFELTRGQQTSLLQEKGEGV